MNITKKLSILIVAVITLTCSAVVSADDNWFVRGYVGYSNLSDQSTSASDTQLGVSALDAEVDGGFLSGLGLAYQFSAQWAAEVAWEYRSNDASVVLSDGRAFTDGNYASNVFSINGIYSLPSQSSWQPYVGFGVLLGQEIDIDIEENGVENSFSTDGDIGYQVFTGVNRAISSDWVFQGELRYGAISNISLDAENGSGSLDGFDYKPLSLHIGLGYRF